VVVQPPPAQLTVHFEASRQSVVQLPPMQLTVQWLAPPQVVSQPPSTQLTVQSLTPSQLALHPATHSRVQLSPAPQPQLSPHEIVWWSSVPRLPPLAPELEVVPASSPPTDQS
jgi:hypothetical protein